MGGGGAGVTISNEAKRRHQNPRKDSRGQKKQVAFIHADGACGMYAGEGDGILELVKAKEAPEACAYTRTDDRECR